MSLIPNWGKIVTSGARLLVTLPRTMKQFLYVVLTELRILRLTSTMDKKLITLAPLSSAMFLKI